MTMHPAYRADIDGLRAFAVLSVLIYHLNNSWLLGGFVGVDVFFVISGYLITTIIYKEVQNKSFSFSNFYARRIRRIFPALFAMLITSAVAAILILPKAAYQSFFRDFKAAAGQFGNIRFAREVEYMEIGTEASPLLHTWSLGVEEQFYLVWPLLIVGVLAIAKPKHLKAAMLGLFVISLVLCEYFLNNQNSKQAFYMFYSRSYELIIGSVIALGMLPKLKSKITVQAITTLGAVLLCGSIFYSRGDNFPGVMSLFPAVGAALVIYAGKEGWFNKLLAIKPLVAIGLISYSLYLWHWPLIAFTTNFTGEGLTNTQALVIGALSFVLGYLSWRYIERPFRKSLQKETGRFWLPPRKSIAKGFSVITLMIVMGNLVGKHPETFGRDFLNPMYKEATAKMDFAHPQCTPDGKNPKADEHDLNKVVHCIFGEKAPEVLILGDSHGQSLRPLVQAWAEEKGLTYSSITISAHSMYFDDYEVKRSERWITTPMELTKIVKKYLEAGDIKYLFIANRYDHALTEDFFRFKDIGEDVSRMAKSKRLISKTIEAVAPIKGVTTVLIGQPPVLSVEPALCIEKKDRIPLYKWFIETPPCPDEVPFLHQDLLAELHGYIAEEIKGKENLKFFNTNPYIKKVYSDDGLLLYNDDDHLSKFGALSLLPKLKEFL